MRPSLVQHRGRARPPGWTFGRARVRSSSLAPVTEIAGHPAARSDFEEAGVRISLYQVAKLEDLVDRDALLRDDLVPDPPYWAHLWIGATALARFLARSVDL